MSTPVLLASPGEPPITPPTHVLDFSDIGDLSSAALSPDGSHLYALVRGEAIDLGWAMSQLWPEWMGTLAGLTAFILALLIVRRVRRPQRDGDPYCRRCNYNLSGRAAGDLPCPECGVDLTKRPPVKGRRAWKRSLPFAIALVLVLGWYGALWAFKVPRGAEWLRPDWTSISALKWSDYRALQWLRTFCQAGDIVIEIDAATGERERIVCARASATYFQLVLTPDGSGFYLSLPSGDGVDLVRVSNGRVGASYTVGPPLPGGGHWRGRQFCYVVGGDVVVGHTSDGSALLSYWSDSKAIAYAVAWNPKTGESVTIATTPAYVDTSTGKPLCEGRRFIMAGQTDPVRVISTPLFIEAYSTKTYEVRWFGPDGSETRKVDLETMVSPYAHPAVTPDGSFGFFFDQQSRGVMALDLATGSQAGSVDLDGNNGGYELVATADGIRLLVPAYQYIGVRNIQLKDWTAYLKHPEYCYAPHAITSPTSFRAAAVFQCPAKNKPGVSSAAVIWDIPDMLSTAGQNSDLPKETKP